MSSKTVEKIYLDSNVWFSFLLKGNQESNKDSIEYEQADIILNKINSDSNLIALTSHLVILEITSIIRKKIVAKKKINGNISINDKENKQELKSTIDKLTNKRVY
jgi:hypothetical protein